MIRKLRLCVGLLLARTPDPPRGCIERLGLALLERPERVRRAVGLGGGTRPPASGSGRCAT